MGQGTDEEGGMIVTKLFCTGALFFILATAFMYFVDSEDVSDFVVCVVVNVWLLSFLFMVDRDWET